jgi:hypothetical protein
MTNHWLGAVVVLRASCYRPNLFAAPDATAAIECPLFPRLTQFLDAFALFSDSGVEEIRPKVS